MERPEEEGRRPAEEGPADQRALSLASQSGHPLPIRPLTFPTVGSPLLLNLREVQLVL